MGRQSLRLFLSILLFSFAITSVSAIGQANDHQAPATSAYAYVGTCPGYPRYCNNGDNQINGFAVAADGSAQPIPGSPFSAASAGLSANPNFLFAVGGIAYQNIYTYAPASDGSLTQVGMVNGLAPGGCGGDQVVGPLSPEPSGRFLYAGNGDNSCGTYYTAWSISPTGQLSYVNEPLPFEAYAWGSTLTFSPDDRFAYTGTVAEYDGALAGFIRDQQGSLVGFSPNPALPPSPGANQYLCDVGNTASSSAGFVSVLWYDGLYCYDGGPGFAEIANYTVNSDGTLNLVPGSEVVPAVNLQNMLYDPSGQYLAVVGCVSSWPYCEEAAIQIYKLQPGGGLVAAGPVQTAPGVRNLVSVAWDNANHLYTYVSGNSSGPCTDACGLYIFNNNDGVLTPAPGSPHPIQNNIVGLAVLPAN